MGGLCSRGPIAHESLYAKGRDEFYESSDDGESRQHMLQLNLNTQSKSSPLRVRERMVTQLQQPKQIKEASPFCETGTTGYARNEDDFYDGIPRFRRTLSQKSRSMRSKQAPTAKTSEVSSRLASTLGLGKAVEVLDNFGSSMANLNPGSGFASGGTTKGNELSILAFEVANTIVKGSSLMQSLSKRSIRQLKEVVLPSEGVQHVVSTDMNVLLKIVATDKREELKIFSGEVVRFGNMCKDPQWHDLDRYFEKRSRLFTPHEQLQEEAASVMQQMITLVQYTAELYHELHALDIYEQDCQRKCQEGDNSNPTSRGDSLAILKAELKSQRKQVKILKKKSLWSRSLEEVMGKLVDIVLFLNWEIHNTFGSADGDTPSTGSLDNQQRLGPVGLGLHYANIVLQIDSIVARSSVLPPNARDALYQNLPPSIRSSLRFKLQSFHVKKELTVTEIKAEMEKTLHWLVPIATNTAKAHHGFGWVGEWANTRSEVNRKPAVSVDVIQVETLHHADREKTEAYILELVLWLNYLIRQSKIATKGDATRSPIKSPIPLVQETSQQPLQETSQQPMHNAASASSPSLRIGDQEILWDVNNNKRIRGISKSQDFDSLKSRLVKHDRLSKSSSSCTTRRCNELDAVTRHSSCIPVIDFSVDTGRALDVIDRVDTYK